MNKLLFTLSLAVAMSFLATAYADQRCDMDTQNCHISLDPNDDDTEIDVSAAIFNAQVNRYVDADGLRKANGSYHGEIRVPLGNARVRPDLLVPNTAGDIFMVGSANTRYLRGDYITAANTACNLVRSNYQENTGSDDQNQTEYTTNNWDLTVTWLGYEGIDGEVRPNFTFTDLEFDYNEDGVVDLSDFSIFIKEYRTTEVGIWKVAMNCRSAIAQ